MRTVIWEEPRRKVQIRYNGMLYIHSKPAPSRRRPPLPSNNAHPVTDPTHHRKRHPFATVHFADRQTDRHMELTTTLRIPAYALLIVSDAAKNVSIELCA